MPGTPAAVAANHHKLSGLCQFEQAGCRSIAHHDFVHDDIGIPVLPSAQTPGEHFLLLVFEVSPFDRRPIEPRKVEGPMSLHACSATKSTPRRDASSKAISAANPEVGEPSMPTTTGACGGRAGRGSSGITATGP